VSKHHKRRQEEEGGNRNSLLGNLDINQIIQLLANMNRKPEPQNSQQASGMGEGLGNLFQAFLSSMKKEEEVVKPEEIIVENDEPVQVYSNEELSELIEQLKTLIATLQNSIEHKEDE